MSDYGNPPRDPDQPDPDGRPGQDPYGQAAQNPYGQPSPYGQPYGQAPYGQAPHGQAQPGYGTPGGGYASWFSRVGASLLDALLATLAGLPMWIGYVILAASTTTTTNADGTVSTSTDPNPVALALIVIGLVTYLAFFIWNTFFRQGRTGYTIGKGVLGIRLLNERGGQPIGAGMAFLRQLAHILDGICYLGYLWPLWDPKRQTFADKIVGTIVVYQPQG